MSDILTTQIAALALLAADLRVAGDDGENINVFAARVQHIGDQLQQLVTAKEKDDQSRVDGVPEGAHGDLPRPASEVTPKFVQREDGDWVCEHGTASDVHCCGCHSGFLFDSRKCVCF